MRGWITDSQFRGAVLLLAAVLLVALLAYQLGVLDTQARFAIPPAFEDAAP
jgi:hypothetical protein